MLLLCAQAAAASEAAWQGLRALHPSLSSASSPALWGAGQAQPTLPGHCQRPAAWGGRPAPRAGLLHSESWWRVWHHHSETYALDKGTSKTVVLQVDP